MSCELIMSPTLFMTISARSRINISKRWHEGLPARHVRDLDPVVDLECLALFLEVLEEHCAEISLTKARDHHYDELALVLRKAPKVDRRRQRWRP